MIVLSWNVKGLGGVEKRRLVKEAIKSCNPNVVVIQETKKEELSGRLVRWILGPDLVEWCVVPMVGIVGGILCAWNPSSVSHSDKWIGSYSISVSLKDLGLGHVWRLFTGMYGPAITTNRKEFLAKLVGVKERWSGPWVVGGDFNVIRFVNEKRPCGRITRSIKDFDQFIRDGDLRDVLLYNAKFTWTNGQDNPILSRLDRFLVSGG